MRRAWIFCKTCDTLFEADLHGCEQAPGGVYYWIEANCGCPVQGRITLHEPYDSSDPEGKNWGSKDNPVGVHLHSSEQVVKEVEG